MKNEISCGAVVFHDGKVLIIKSPRGIWNIPKGHITNCESAIDCLRRELREETGINDFSFIADSYFSTTYYNKEFGVKKTVNVFVIETSSEDVVLTEECVDYRWVPINEVREILKKVNASAAISRALDVLKGR
jgi:8-oxo-dGTP diphosphatase